jgi:hypothetical protein
MSARPTHHGQEGFALILALLALMLLTLLGLTLATTSTTELQIAANYRWSQQALYNAEAGLEVGRFALAAMGDGSLVLPAARGADWNEGTGGPAGAPAPRFARADAYGGASRNFENGNCDRRGNGAGYGVVLDDGALPEAPFQNVTTIYGQTLNGAFTLWVRRRLNASPATPGNVSDDVDSNMLILTSEGTAPYIGSQQNNARVRATRAVRVLEADIQLTPACTPDKAQGSQSGFSRCNPL